MTDRKRPVPQSKPVSGEGEPDLDAKIGFLRQPASYPDSTRNVEVVETHMSWVFLTDRLVYKLKKPVRLPFLDFSTVALRKHFCEEEVRLNRRLAPQIYLGTIPITKKAGGVLSLAGDGPAVDWLVRMSRLPSDRMLDHAIRNGSVSDQDVERLAIKLATFYRAAPPVGITTAEYRRRFEGDISANLTALKAAEGLLPQEEVVRVHEAQLAVLRSTPSPLDARAAEDRIIEAHGDLRPEHIFLGAEPQIIDCLEFNLDFRCLDPVDELCFLAIECEMLGAPAIGTKVLEKYRSITGDRPPPRLLDFYKCHRACLRAKLAFWHLQEANIREPERWPRQTRAYFKLAGIYADRIMAAAR